MFILVGGDNENSKRIEGGKMLIKITRYPSFLFPMRLGKTK